MFNLAEYAARCGVADGAAFARRAEALRVLLKEANQTTNLTRITEPADFALKHAADSLAVARFFPEFACEKLAVADIGCGAGFPSLILALAFPQLTVTAIDSTAKKTAFVRQAAAALQLKNLTVVTGRSCELNRKAEFQHAFDRVTARAVAASDVLSCDASKFLRPGGKFVFYKTPEQAAEEVPRLRAGTAKTKRKWQVTAPFELPENAGTRLFVYSLPETT